jgi:hypothetical protein
VQSPKSKKKYKKMTTFQKTMAAEFKTILIFVDFDDCLKLKISPNMKDKGAKLFGDQHIAFASLKKKKKSKKSVRTR